MNKLMMVASLFFTLPVFAQSNFPGAPQGKRACDQYIAQYCSGEDHRGPACLKNVSDYQSLVSADCLKDIERKGPPPGPPPDAANFQQLQQQGGSRIHTAE